MHCNETWYMENNCGVHGHRKAREILTVGKPLLTIDGKC